MSINGGLRSEPDIHTILDLDDLSENQRIKTKQLRCLFESSIAVPPRFVHMLTRASQLRRSYYLYQGKQLETQAITLPVSKQWVQPNLGLALEQLWRQRSKHPTCARICLLHIVRLPSHARADFVSAPGFMTMCTICMTCHEQGDELWPRWANILLFHFFVLA